MSELDETPSEPDAIRPDVRQITSEVPPGVVERADGTTNEFRLAQPKPHPGFWWSVLWCIGFLLVTQVPGAILASVILFLYGLQHPGALRTPEELMASPATPMALAAAFFLTEILVVGVSLLVIRLMIGRDWKRQLAVRLPSAAHVFFAVVSLPGLVVIANGAYLLLKRNLPDYSSKLGMPDMMHQMSAIFSQWPWPFAVLVIGLGPGLGEELWCRGFLGRGLVGNYGVVLGVIFTSFFFGLIHVDPAQGMMAMLMGLYLHFTYLVTRSFWVPVLLHFLNNSFSVVSPHLPMLDALDADPAKSPAHLFAAAIALVAVVIWALYTSRARLSSQGNPALWQPAAPGVEYPPEDSGVRVVHPLPSDAAFGLTALALAAFIGSCYLTMSRK